MSANRTIELRDIEVKEMIRDIQNALDTLIEQSSAECDSDAIEAAQGLLHTRRKLEQALAEDEPSGLARIEKAGGAS